MTTDLVTGGAGFIGSNLVDALLAEGRRVVVLDDLSTGRAANVPPQADLVECDLLACADVVDRVRPERIFHLAAQVDIRRAVVEPEYDARINVGGTAAVLEAARAAGVQRFVLASTGGAIYGEAEIVPTPEDTPQRPLSPYGQSKAAAEGYVELYARLHGLCGGTLRLANVYGPRQDPLGEGGVIAIFCGLKARGGTGVVFGDGGQTRDFVYVGDVAEAFVRAGAGTHTGALNIATGVETSITDLAAMLDLPVREEAQRAGEVRRSVLDARRAAAVLGWTPETALDAGLARTVAWVPSSAGR